VASENNLTELIHMVCCEAGMKIWVLLLEGGTSNIWAGKNALNSARFRTTLVFDRGYFWKGSRYQ